MSDSKEYAAERHGEMLVLTLISDLDTKIASSLEKDVQTAMKEKSAPRKIVINTLSSYSIDVPAMRMVGKMALDLKKQGCTFFVLEPPPSLRKVISDLGLLSLLRTADTLEEVRLRVEIGAAPSAPHSASAQRLDIEFVNPFIAGAINTLSAQYQMDCTPLKPAVKDSSPEPIKVDIAGVIGIASERFTGSIAICFPKEVFLGAMSKKRGEKYTEISKDLEDGASELLNIITGHAKTVLSDKGVALAGATPTVVRGENLQAKHHTFAKTLVLIFGTQFGNFYIEVGMKAA